MRAIDLLLASALAAASMSVLRGQDPKAGGDPRAGQDPAAPAARTPEDLPFASRAIRANLSSLDFDGAQGTLDELLRKKPEMKRDAAELATEVTLARDVWTRVERALGDKRREKKPQSLTFLRGPRDPQGVPAKPYQVLDLSGCALRIQPQGGKVPETRCALSLERESLLALAGAQPAADPELKEGLGLLLLFHRGPEAARPLLLDASLPGARRGPSESRLTACADLWLAARHEGSVKRAAQFESVSPSPPVDALDFAADEVAELMNAWRPRPEYDKVRRPLRKLFAGHREEALKAQPPERFFRAREAKLQKGVLELAYDFSTKEQTEDFVQVKGIAGSVQWEKAQRTVRVLGEVRFQEGNPFRRRISVSGKVSGVDTSAPNVNVGFWTAPDDVLSRRFDTGFLRSWRDKGGKGREPEEDRPADYFILGMGFKVRSEIENTGVGGIARSWMPLYAREPTFAILAGTRMKRPTGEIGLGEVFFAGTGEVLWDASAVNQLKSSSFTFTADVDEKGKIQWTVNRRAVQLDGSPDLKRLQSTEPRAGSVTFFTNGRSFHLGPFKISGVLDPEWQTARARAVAQAELRKLDGVLPEAGKKKVTIEIEVPDKAEE